MLRVQLLLSIIALFVHSNSIRRLPPNRANGVAVFEGSPIRYNIAFILQTVIDEFSS